ncbi:MAG: glutamate racemase [bacterium]
MDRPIGIFDSGVGGLTVLHEVMSRLPFEDLIYFGDTARVPYGIKSAETVTRYSVEIADFLLAKKIKMLIVACNTASSVALPDLAARCDIPVIGVLVPGAKAAVKYSAVRKIGVIGTEATIGSSAYVKAIHGIDAGVEVYTKACPLFVPLAEEGWADHRLTILVAMEYLKDFQNTGIDTLVLGCTHYPILKSAIQEVVGKEVRLVDSAEETAQEVERMLVLKGNPRIGNPHPVRKFYVTDSPDRFRKVGECFLKHPLTNVERAVI